jgi:hypothetical protein
MKKLVIIESPFAGNWFIHRRNKIYLNRCIADSLARGEAPFASHKMYPDVLRDEIPDERALGIEVGFCWGEKAELTAVYLDYNCSPGMHAGAIEARINSRKVEHRYIGKNPNLFQRLFGGKR